MTTTPNLGIDYLEENQVDAEVMVNEGWNLVDAVAQLSVIDKDVFTPPGSPADGDCYIVAATATGAWTGQEDSIAFYNSGWRFVPPREGMLAWVQDEDLIYYYDGAAWAELETGGSSGVILKEEGSTVLGAATTINFVGGCFTLTDVGGVGTLTLHTDTDGTLAANSDTVIPTQKAVKTAIATAVTGLLDFKGNTDCSANPNYPAASKGDAYMVSVAGKIGGGSGTSVDVGDVYVASADNAGGTQAVVGTSWFVLEHNRTGLIIGTDIQAWDADLDAFAGLTGAANGLPYFTGLHSMAVTTLSAFGITLIDDADASAARTTLGLIIGTNVQAYDAELAAIAGLTSAANKGITFTGSGSAATYDLSTFALTFLDDANAAAVRATLGFVGALATTGDVSISMSVPASIMTVSGSPAGAGGTFAITLGVQNANKFWAGPTTGADAAPTFRVLGIDDFPAATITYAKLQNMTTARLLGRTTAGSGVIEELSVGAGLSLAAGVLNTVNRRIVLSAAGGWGSTTNGALGPVRTETATNKVNRQTLSFVDSGLTKTYGEWTVVMPADYAGGTITAKFVWDSAASASTNAVVWGLAGVAESDNDTLDTAHGTAQEVTDANNGTGKLNISGSTAAITIAGTPAAGSIVFFRCYRDSTNGGDTLGATANLISIILEY